MQFTRFRPVRGVLRTASTDSIVLLQLRRIRNTYRITNLICSRKLGGSVSLAVLLSSAARRAHGSSALVHAMRDLIASNAPLRNGSHKARQNPPKHYPGDPMGAAAPLVCLSSISFFKQRKIWPPEVVGCRTRLVKP